jgi:aflatoxin B1 aldehyde reductase
MSQIKISYGGASLNPSGAWKDKESIGQLFDALIKLGVDHIDTARLYGPSEGLIGEQPSRTSFTIDTKIQGGFSPGSAAKDAIIADAQDSLDKVGIKQFDILYLHSPDDTVPIAETLDGINEVYKKGIFKRFGLSNFTAQQVQEAYDVAKEKGYVLPSVYQGNYSPIARHLETLLFPTLRKLGFAFYAYSPLAGGFLTKSPADLDAGAGRFNEQAIGGMYKRMYDKPSLRNALAEWNDVAEKEGVSKAELAYRWVGYNSALSADKGDAVIFAGSSMNQVEQTAKGLKKGKLSEEAAKRIQQIWESVKADAPVDNFGANKV